MAHAYERLTADEFVAADGVEDWRVEGVEVRAVFATGSFVKGLALVNEIGRLAEEVNHHPDLTLTYPKVGVSLTTHDTGTLTTADRDLAQAISAAARGLGVEAGSN
ncbi:4a-hydroxytetrahydrobiopterin dehydratase [Nocardioides sp. WS12]|uniref:4a-hydroxytetrahydrobiopterin dehydratase n=1 Tax=Nocardioides sp. WS12 TaxID=2486272 RepID=UPI0015F7FBC0|nr:4a-hydroxytetrahydrobiopterin dehydratase [Nocardioides sp. WS12]